MIIEIAFSSRGYIWASRYGDWSQSKHDIRKNEGKFFIESAYTFQKLTVGIAWLSQWYIWEPRRPILSKKIMTVVQTSKAQLLLIVNEDILTKLMVGQILMGWSWVIRKLLMVQTVALVYLYQQIMVTLQVLCSVS